ncbi:hypothetical protein FB45DRAFT_1060566, partial [Roridomyces roridus]
SRSTTTPIPSPPTTLQLTSLRLSLQLPHSRSCIRSHAAQSDSFLSVAVHFPSFAPPPPGGSVVASSPVLALYLLSVYSLNAISLGS